MSPPPATFALSRATEADMAELVKLQYDCFVQKIREIFMGCMTEDDLPRLERSFIDELTANPHVVWIKLVDTTTGHMVAASQWKVFPSAAPASVTDDTAPEWLEGEARANSEKVIGEANEARRRANPGGHVHLHICFTHPQYRRQGAGSMMLRWGCDLADQLFVSSWVEASPEGIFLYKVFGFEEHSPAAGGEGGRNMQREPRLKEITSASVV